MMEIMMEGDPLCSIPLQARVRKMFRENDQDPTHLPGHKGTVIGSKFVEGVEGYLVQFDGDPDGFISLVSGDGLEPLL